MKHFDLLLAAVVLLSVSNTFAEEPAGLAETALSEVSLSELPYTDFQPHTTYLVPEQIWNRQPFDHLYRHTPQTPKIDLKACSRRASDERPTYRHSGQSFVLDIF